jgi:hypothetical protein
MITTATLPNQSRKLITEHESSVALANYIYGDIPCEMLSARLAQIQDSLDTTGTHQAIAHGIVYNTTLDDDERTSDERGYGEDCDNL